MIAYALLAAVVSAFPNPADASTTAADFAPATTQTWPTPTIRTNVNPLTTETPSPTVVSGSTVSAATFFNPSASLAISGTTLRAASTPSASAGAEGGEEGEGSRVGVSAVALVAAIAGLVGVVPL